MTFWAQCYDLCSVEKNGTLEVLGAPSASPVPSLLTATQRARSQTKRPIWVISFLPLWPSPSSNQMSSQRKLGNPKSDHSKW